MSLEELFQQTVAELRRRRVTFAVAGGFAASLYRREPRVTMDVDLAIATDNALEIATAVIETVGLTAAIAREADLAGGPLFAIRRRRTQPCMVVGRRPGAPLEEGVDLLLPAIPWVESALQRAQANKVDFGFGPVPVLTIEDMILSKLYVLRRLRAKDLDDLQSIFEAGREIDRAYLDGHVRRLGIVIPRATEPFLPEWLVKLTREVARSKSRKNQS